MKIFQCFTTNRKIAFHVFLVEVSLTTPNPPIFFKIIVRSWKVVINLFSIFAYKFSKYGEKLSFQTVKSFSSGFWEDHS